MVILYANGITEELKPQSYTYTDKELLDLLPDFDNIKTFRLSEVPNTWCLWGENNPIDKRYDEFNQIATNMINKPIYSPIFFIHDTELNPDWKVTDEIIQRDYSIFKKSINQFFDEIIKNLIYEREQNRTESGQTNLIILEQEGISDDKRIIYKFDINKQTDEFLSPSYFNEFANKVYDFLKEFYKNGDIFVIYADKNILITLDDENVKPLIDKIMLHYESLEQYELCSNLKAIFDKWATYKNRKTKTPRRKKPNKPSKNQDLNKTDNV